MISVNRVLLYIFFLTFISCKKIKKTYQIHGYAQGTTYTVKYHHHKKINTYYIDTLLREIDLSMSTYVQNSSINLLNKGNNIALDPLIQKVIKRSIEICHETNGMFDITVKPLVEYWGFGSDKRRHKKHVDFDSSSYVLGCDKLFLKEGKIIKSDAVEIDLNGIAQGFTVDYISDYLYNEEGVDDFMIEIGGEINCVGNNLGHGWKIGIDKPIEKKREIEFILNLDNIALATSGSYRNYYYMDSVKINHTISPKTFRPTQNKLISSTILYSDCMSADAYATACMSFGLEGARDFLKENNIIGCLIYIENGDTLSYFSPGFSSFLHRSPGSAPQ